MFINKKENAETPANPILDKQKTIVAIENFPVHTMETDLNKTDSGENINNYSPPQNQTSQKSITLDKTEVDSKTSKMLSIVAAVFVFIMIVGGGYYFWMTRVKDSTVDLPVDQPIVNDTASTQPEVVTPILPAFSETQPNFLSLDIQNASLATLQEKLKKNATEVVKMHTTKPIEFIITDQLNNPVSFADFTKKIGILLPPSILSQLTGSFSFYIYADNSYARFGISAATKDAIALKIAITQEESNLIRMFEPIFLVPNYDSKSATSFKSSFYNGSEIHYVNIPSSEPLSLDYSISNTRLTIGTSKLTMRAILDHYQTATQPAK